MAGKARSHTEQITRLLDSLGDYIRNAPGAELLEAAREEGRDPGEVHSRVKGILKSALKSHQKQKLAETKEGHSRELAAISQGDFDLPKTPEKRRALFMAALAQASQLQAAFTIQHRELSEFSDEDIESNLKKLAQLGLLQKICLPEEK